jgi:glutamine---fructose-6-phosphate transaminase (isomerizing)
VSASASGWAALLPLREEVTRVGAQCRQVLFIARGSSDNAAVYGSYLLQVFGGRLATLASPSVATAYRARVDLDGVLAVALSQSGETAEIVQTLQWAQRCGARTVAVTNAADSALVRAAEVALVTQAGVERAVPATKTYTAQLVALAVLALGLGAPLPESQLRAAPDAVAALLSDPGGALDEMVERLRGVNNVVVSGRGMVFSTALEAALKLKEACYLHAVGLSYADLLHGPIAVVDAKSPAILTATPAGPTLPGTLALARRIAGAGAPVFGIGGGGELAGACDLAVPGPDLPDWLAPIGLIVPAQLLAERLARRLGHDPDTPRGLAKVTRTD